MTRIGETGSDAVARSKRPLVIWGASGHATVVADIVCLQNDYEIAGFLDDFRQVSHEAEFCGSRILGGREILPTLADQGVISILIAVGDPHARLSLAQVAQSHGLQLALAVHPRAIVAANVEMGGGTVIAAGAVVNPGVRLGPATIVNTLAGVDHGCRLAEGATVCPGARLGGNVIVERGAWIGIGATVRENLTIGEYAVVGAGAVVVRDVPARSVVYGVPARVVRTIEAPPSAHSE